MATKQHQNSIFDNFVLISRRANYIVKGLDAPGLQERAHLVIEDLQLVLAEMCQLSLDLKEQISKQLPNGKAAPVEASKRN